MGKLRSLQALRFFAALGVVQCHLMIAAHNRATLGAAGVDVFFVLSGYIVSLSARKRPDDFLKNRLTRVLPVYYVAALMAVVAAAHQSLEWRRLLATITLWPAYDVVVAPYLPVAWSLCYEMLFYGALAMVLRGVRVTTLLICLVLAGVGAALTHYGPLLFLGSPIILEFLAGAVLVHLPRRSMGVGLFAVGVAIVGFAVFGAPHAIGFASQPTADLADWPRVLAWGIPAALLVYGALQLEPLFRHRWAIPLVFLGDASYSLYLFHMLILKLLDSAKYPAWIGGAVSVAVCAFLYVALERPLIKIARQWWRLEPGVFQTAR